MCPEPIKRSRTRYVVMTKDDYLTLEGIFKEVRRLSTSSQLHVYHYLALLLGKVTLKQIPLRSRTVIGEFFAHNRELRP